MHIVDRIYWWIGLIISLLLTIFLAGLAIRSGVVAFLYLLADTPPFGPALFHDHAQTFCLAVIAMIVFLKFADEKLSYTITYRAAIGGKKDSADIRRHLKYAGEDHRGVELGSR